MITRPGHRMDWYPAADLAALAHAAERVKALDGAAVEVGCFTGQSTELLASIFGTVLAVDPWGDMDATGVTGIDGKQVYEEFVANTRYTDVIRFRCGWDEFFRVFDGPLAFLHVDGIHTYNEVHDNLTVAIPYLVRGGVICGHDHSPQFPEVEEAVRDTFGEYTVESAVWSWQG